MGLEGIRFIGSSTVKKFGFMGYISCCKFEYRNFVREQKELEFGCPFIKCSFSTFFKIRRIIISTS